MASHGNFNVLKRDNTYQEVKFDKIQQRIRVLAEGLQHIDIVKLAQDVIANLKNGMKTSDIDLQTIRCAEYMQTTHLDYAVLAARIAVSNLHKETSDSFVQVMKMLEHDNRLNDGLLETLRYYEQQNISLDQIINMKRDYDFGLTGIKMLEKSYLLRVNDKIVERPQYLFLRVALEIHQKDLNRVNETYDLLSLRKMIHATPTLFNAGTKHPQLSSCFLLKVKSDSLNGIYQTLTDTANISKYAGGIGINISHIRAAGSPIAGTGGHSNGIVPMLRVFNASSMYVDQGGGKRKGSMAVYLEPWHADVFDFLEMSRISTPEDRRAFDLFTALWYPSLFIQRLQNDEKWTLFCPSNVPGLAESWGDKFNELYTKYEADPTIKKRTVNARDILKAIATTVQQRGFPFAMFKDICNAKSNQQHCGTILGSNLCTEIVQFSSEDEIAVCNLASINLYACVKHVNDCPYFDFDDLRKTTRVAVRNLDNIIDRNYYVTPESKKSNMRHRPMAIGVQGLADVFAAFMYPYESQNAIDLNKQIFEIIYLSAVVESTHLAEERGRCESFDGSPASRGLLQFDLWSVEPTLKSEWEDAKRRVMKFGMRNILTTGPMPTVSTANIINQSESTEPYFGNITSLGISSGTHMKINTHLAKWLNQHNMWNSDIVNKIIKNRGSVQGIDGIPKHVQDVFKTVWEIKQSALIDLAADRGPYIDQSQSLNLYLEDVSAERLMQIYIRAHRKGLKTAQYYLRTKSAANATQFTVTNEESNKKQRITQCDLQSTCSSCSS